MRISHMFGADTIVRRFVFWMLFSAILSVTKGLGLHIAKIVARDNFAADTLGLGKCLS